MHIKKYRNYYRCPQCLIQWYETHLGLADTVCTQCGSIRIDPYKAEAIDASHLLEARKPILVELDKEAQTYKMQVQEHNNRVVNLISQLFETTGKGGGK